MTETLVAADSLRARLQLAVGPLARLGVRLSSAGPDPAFAATDRTSGQSLVVTLLEPPPIGPDPEALAERIAGLRHLEHVTLDIPIASGELEGQAWLIEAVSQASTAAERLETGPLSIIEAVTAMRDVTRALAAMHRHGIAHGALSLDSIRMDGATARLVGVGRTLEASKLDDLDALAQVTWALFTGEHDPLPVRPLSRMRRGISPELDALCAAMLASNRAHRPQSAEAILLALDAVPTRRPSSPSMPAEPGHHDARPRRLSGWWMLAFAVVLLVSILAARS